MTAVPVPPAPDYETAIREALDVFVGPRRAIAAERVLDVVRPLVAAEVAAERERIAQAIEVAAANERGRINGREYADAYIAAARLAREVS